MTANQGPAAGQRPGAHVVAAGESGSNVPRHLRAIQQLGNKGTHGQDNIEFTASNTGYVWALVLSSDSCLDVYGLREQRNALAC